MKPIKLGFNWQRGPFELLDEIGVDWFVDRLEVKQRSVPALLQPRQPLYRIETGRPCFREVSGSYRPIPKAEGILLLSDVKLQKPALLDNGSARLWDIGEGVACLEFCAKMNTLDLEVMNLIHQSINKINGEFKALVIYNDAELFSAGANLGLLVAAIQQQAWSDVEGLLKLGQETYKALKYAPFPVVGAPSGLALGGGCEILLHCDAIQAHAELYIGLVEVGVGLIPGWGGCKEYLHRWLQQKKRPAGSMPAIVKAFETIGMAEVAKSAFEARERLFLAESDGITMNRSRLLADAKTRALALSDGYTPPQPMEFQLPGKTAKIALQLAVENFHAQGKASDYDVEIALQLADILSGGECDMTEVLSEDDMLTLEREAFMQLVQQPETFARLKHMLKTGKPLRN